MGLSKRVELTLCSRRVGIETSWLERRFRSSSSILFSDSSRQPEDCASGHQRRGHGIRFHRSASQEEQDSLSLLNPHRHGLSPSYGPPKAVPATANNQQWRSMKGEGRGRVCLPPLSISSPLPMARVFNR